MSNQDGNIQKTNEEISIIDLIAILIRYRKLIILGTIVPSVIASIWLFAVKPILKPVIVPEPKTEISANYTIRLNYYPQRIYEGVGAVFNRYWDFNGRILQDFVNPIIMGSIYENNQFAEVVAEGEGEKYIEKVIENKSITCINSIDTTYAISIKMPITSVEVLNSYIESFVNYELNLVQEKWQVNYIELLKERYQNRLSEFDKADPKTINFEELQRIKETLQDIELMEQENKPIFEIEGKPVINKIEPELPAKENKLKSLVIVFITSFFILVFIAFVLNTIQTIKADPVSSQKIKDAWESGKKAK